MNEEIGGLNGLVRAEISDVQSLVRKRLAKRSRLLALRRQQAEIEGARSRNIATVARAKQQIAETRLRVSELKTQRLKQMVEELRATQTELFDLEERVRSAEDVLVRTKIIAPLDATIVGPQIHPPRVASLGGAKR